MQLNLSLGELATLVGGQATHNPSLLIKRLASLDQAGPEDIAVIFDVGDASVFEGPTLEKIQATRAGVIIAPHELVPGRAHLLVPDPLAALRVLSAFSQKNNSGKDCIAQSAVVDKTAKLGADVRVGPGAIIEAGALVGDGSIIGARVFVGAGCVVGKQVLVHPGATILNSCVIGDHSIINSNAVIGSDGFGFRVSKQGMEKIPHIGKVIIGKGVEIGAGCCIDRALFDATIIGDGVKLDNLVHIAHNVIVGPHTAILAQTGVAGSVRIGAGCQIGGQVGIKDHVQIGNQVKIVSQSGVMKNLGDGSIVAGSPTMPFTQWKKLMVFFAQFDNFVRPLQALKKLYEKHEKGGGFWQKFF